MDALAELTPGISPYAFCFNNPVRYIDPLGLAGEDTNNDHSKDMWGRNKYDSFTGIYIPPYERPNLANYGNSMYGHWETNSKTYYHQNYIYNSQSELVYYGNVQGQTVWSSTFIWDSQEEKQYGLPRMGGGDGLDWDDLIIGLPGMAITTGGYIKQSDWWWLTAKGTFKSTSLLKVGISGKYVRGVQGFRNSYQLAGKAASLYKVGGNILGGLGVAVSIYDMTQNGVNWSNSIDAIMGATTFIPGVGWIISGSYFTASFATELITGKSISEHINEW